MKASRQFPVPKGVQQELGVVSVSIDEIELLASACGGLSGPWAARVLDKEDKKAMREVFGEDTRLPVGLMESGFESDFVISALAIDDRVWSKDGWTTITAGAQCTKCAKCGGSHHLDSAKALAHSEPDFDEELLEYEDEDDEPEYPDFDEDDIYEESFLAPLETQLKTVIAEDLLEPVIEEEPFVEDPIEEAPIEAIPVMQCPRCGAHLGTGRDMVPLSMADVASIIRALQDGIDAVVMRPYAPVAHLTSPMVAAGSLGSKGEEAAAAGVQELPPGSVVVAVVDELDRNAVLDVLGVAPGPLVFIRTEKTWVQDESWRKTLTGISPPPVVALTDPEMVKMVLSQVDAYDPEAMKKQRKEMLEAAETANAEPDTGMISSLKPIEWAYENSQLRYLVAAGAKSAASKAVNKAANKAAGAERLRQYWGYGKGAAKIRWGTPGDWRRCVKQLSKYLGVRSKGYCNLLHARVNGAWPNSKVQVFNPGTSAEAVAKQLSAAASGGSTDWDESKATRDTDPGQEGQFDYKESSQRAKANKPKPTSSKIDDVRIPSTWEYDNGTWYNGSGRPVGTSRSEDGDIKWNADFNANRYLKANSPERKSKKPKKPKITRKFRAVNKPKRKLTGQAPTRPHRPEDFSPTPPGTLAELQAIAKGSTGK